MPLNDKRFAIDIKSFVYLIKRIWRDVSLALFPQKQGRVAKQGIN